MASVMWDISHFKAFSAIPYYHKLRKEYESTTLGAYSWFMIIYDYYVNEDCDHKIMCIFIRCNQPTGYKDIRFFKLMCSTEICSTLKICNVCLMFWFHKNGQYNPLSEKSPYSTDVEIDINFQPFPGGKIS